MDKEEMHYNSLVNCIWITRIARIHSEKRLLRKEGLFQLLNVYYSFFTIVFSIIAAFFNDNKLSLLTIFMSIFLLVAILYLNAQKFIDHARDFRKNYTDLQKLEFKLKHVTYKETDKIRSIEKDYCTLLDSICNHSTFDYYCALHDSNGEYRIFHYQFWVQVKYYWGIFF